MKTLEAEIMLAALPWALEQKYDIDWGKRSTNHIELAVRKTKVIAYYFMKELNNGTL